MPEPFPAAHGDPQTQTTSAAAPSASEPSTKGFMGKVKSCFGLIRTSDSTTGVGKRSRPTNGTSSSATSASTGATDTLVGANDKPTADVQEATTAPPISSLSAPSAPSAAPAEVGGGTPAAPVPLVAESPLMADTPDHPTMEPTVEHDYGRQDQPSIGLGSKQATAGASSSKPMAVAVGESMLVDEPTGIVKSREEAEREFREFEDDGAAAPKLTPFHVQLPGSEPVTALVGESIPSQRASPMTTELPSVTYQDAGGAETQPREPQPFAVLVGESFTMDQPSATTTASISDDAVHGGHAFDHASGLGTVKPGTKKETPVDDAIGLTDSTGGAVTAEDVFQDAEGDSMPREEIEVQHIPQESIAQEGAPSAKDYIAEAHYPDVPLRSASAPAPTASMHVPWASFLMNSPTPIVMSSGNHVSSSTKPYSTMVPHQQHQQQQQSIPSGSGNMQLDMGSVTVVQTRIAETTEPEDAGFAYPRNEAVDAGISYTSPGSRSNTAPAPRSSPVSVEASPKDIVSTREPIMASELRRIPLGPADVTEQPAASRSLSDNMMLDGGGVGNEGDLSRTLV